MDEKSTKLTQLSLSDVGTSIAGPRSLLRFVFLLELQKEGKRLDSNSAEEIWFISS